MRKITKTLPELAISDVEWAWLAGLFEGEADGRNETTTRRSAVSSTPI